MNSLLILPGAADASAGTSCKVIGQTKRVVTKKKTDYLICSLSGKRKVWKATTPAVGTKATVLKAGGLPFVDLALSVKNFAAQCVLVMKGNEVVAEWNFGNHTPSTKILLASVSKSFTVSARLTNGKPPVLRTVALVPIAGVVAFHTLRFPESEQTR